ncbi:uncharacterized protein [Maniola hyperantus]|uniref:uncharacterized protein isoform X1 n=1 Tax=Aphantopus hyperantus TaxID=2795564 RepID=UPI002126083F
MYYSLLFVFCFSVVVNLSLSGANSAWNAILPLESNTLANNGNTLVSIGNGVNRNNVVILDQADILGNRFGDDSTPAAYQPQAGPTSADHHHHGTSSVLTENNGLDLFNVGYGSGNQNKVIVNTSVQSQNTGSQPLASSSVDNQLKILHSLSEQLQQIATQLIQEMHANIAQQ